MPNLELKPMAVTYPQDINVNPQAMLSNPQAMMQAMTPQVKDLVMTYPRTPLPPPLQSGALPEDLWAQTWDAVHAQIVVEMTQAEQTVQNFTANMPSMNPLSMIFSMCCGRGGADHMAVMGDAMANAGNNQRAWLSLQADTAAAFAPYNIGVVLATEQRYHHGGMHGGMHGGHSYTVTVGLAFDT